MCRITSMSEAVRRMVGDNVKKLRLAAELTQAELAERMRVDRAYISGLEVPMRLFFDDFKRRR